MQALRLFDRSKPAKDGAKELPDAWTEDPMDDTQRAAGNRLADGSLSRSASGAQPAETGPYLPTPLSETGNGRPVPESLRSTMEQTFNTDLSKVRTHSSGAAAKAADDLSARAFTVGDDIYFGQGQYNPGAEKGQELLAHEIAHTVQQDPGDSPRASANVGEDLDVSDPGDPLEREAEMVANQWTELPPPERQADRSAANGLTGSHEQGSENIPISSRGGSGAAATIHRYKVEGPFNFGDPVHEVLTLLSVRGAIEGVTKEQNAEAGELLKGLAAGELPEWTSKEDHNLNAKDTPESFHQFLRGVIWADDPKGYLFDNKENINNYSSGLLWYGEFDPDEKDEPDKLIARTHYGDLQFFHGMAVEKGVDPKQTQDKILTWSEFLIQVATGSIGKDTIVKDVASIKDQFSEYDTLTIRQLFVAHEEASETDIRQRAAGVLLHLIQDSYAEGHVQRDPKTGAIEEFHTYEGQDEDKHAEKDKFVHSKGADLKQIIDDTPGARAAVDHGIQVLMMIDQGKPVSEILKYLRENVFALSPKAAKSDVGVDFKEE